VAIIDLISSASDDEEEEKKEEEKEEEEEKGEEKEEDAVTLTRYDRCWGDVFGQCSCSRCKEEEEEKKEKEDENGWREQFWGELITEHGGRLSLYVPFVM
jgi:hypothetical protein